MSLALPFDEDGIYWIDRLASQSASGGSTNLFQNPYSAGMLAVITYMSVSNISGSSGDAFTIYRVPGSPLFQAQRGAGQADDFETHCFHVVKAQEYVNIACTGSSVWQAEVSGFWTPYYASKIQP